mgnify:CR=1 FL=1
MGISPPFHLDSFVVMAGITKQKSIATESIHHEKTTVCNERPLPSLMKELRVKSKDNTHDHMEKKESES